jgi:hypothetical protein
MEIIIQIASLLHTSHLVSYKGSKYILYLMQQNLHSGMQQFIFYSAHDLFLQVARQRLHTAINLV